MSQNPTRSTLGIVLILVLLSSIFPISYADSGVMAGQRPRRGKNGVAPPSDQPTQGPQTGERPQNTSRREPEYISGDSPDSSPGSVRTGGDPRTAESDLGSQPTQRSRRQPPPFDRPPLGSNPGSETDSVIPEPRPTPSRPRYETARGTRGTGGERSTGRQQPNDQPGRTRSEDIQPPAADRADPAEREGREKPVLRRPADSRNPAEERTGPVLRRPSDSATDPDESSASGSTRSGRTREDRPSDSNPQPTERDEVLRLGATLVNIPILVSDRSGRYIPQLSANDFLLWEDGVQQEVAFFGSEEVPFNVALVLDMSPSVQGSADHIQDAAIEFVRQLRRDDRVMVVSFDRRIHFLTDFTNDRRRLEAAIRTTRTGSGTSVYDAVYEVVERLRGVDGRKALILFSDGEDTTSNNASYSDAIDVVTEADVLVYGLRYPASSGNVRIDPWPRNRIPQIPFPIPFPWPWPRSRRRGPFTNLVPPAASVQRSVVATATPQNWPRRRGGSDFMADVTAAGGGPVYDADGISDLGRLASRIAEELRHVYVVSYYPTNALSNGGFRSIRVRIRSRNDLAVRHRKGYNARDVNRK